MAEISDDHAALRAHCEAFQRENTDLDIRRPAHDPMATPLDRLTSERPATDVGADHGPRVVTVRRALITLSTPRTSFDVWAALAPLEQLLSDYRRLAPRFRFTQTAGDAGIVTGNEYRLTLSDPDLMEAINTAIGCLAPGATAAPRIDQRHMDVRVDRAGPWGGETGELVVQTLLNHALAGAGSLWILAHDYADDGILRVTLDGFEAARWAWAPDFLASRRLGGKTPVSRIIDWDYLFERLAQVLDGEPEEAASDGSFSLTGDADVVAADSRVAEALDIHSGLKPFFDRINP